MWLAVPLIALNVALIMARLRAGVVAYLALSLILPHPTIGETIVAYEILALPAVLASVAARRPRLRHPRFHICLALLFLVVTLGTLVATLKYGSAVDLIRFQGLLRYLVLLGFMRELLQRQHFERILLATVAISSVVGMIQLLVPGLADTFLQLYGRPEQRPLETYALEDFIPRASGTFSNPVVLGSVALFALAIAWAGLLSGTRGRHYGWLLVLAGIAGIASITKTFIIGAPIVLAGGVVLILALRGPRGLRFRRRTFGLAAASVVVAMAFAVYLGAFLQSKGFYIAYYASFLTDPRAALATRYGPGGSIQDAVQVFLDNPLFGVGMTRVRGELIGDSSYTLLLHSSGVVGAMIALGGLFGALYAIRRHRRPTDILVLGALLLAGLAHPIFYSLPGAMALAYPFAPEAGVPTPPDALRPTRPRRPRLQTASEVESMALTSPEPSG